MERLDLQNVLETILGSKNVYFQPPKKSQIEYPCIIYSLNKFGGKRANNKRYTSETRYNLVLIDSNPDSLFFKPLSELVYCAFDRSYVADNLNHFSFNITI